MTVIEARNLSKIYKKQVLFEDFNYRFESGHIYGLVGYNGSGKTVLMKILCGLIRPNTGEVWYDETQLLGRDMPFLPSLGVIIETPGFLDQYSGFENLKQLALIHNKVSDDRIHETMTLLGLDSRSKKPVRTYSLGMKQKLALSQALMEDPQVLLLDEPMNGLDKNSVKNVREILTKLKVEGKIILIASHMEEDIRLLCDQVIDISTYHPQG